MNFFKIKQALSKNNDSSRCNSVMSKLKRRLVFSNKVLRNNSGEIKRNKEIISYENRINFLNNMIGKDYII